MTEDTVTHKNNKKLDF